MGRYKSCPLTNTSIKEKTPQENGDPCEREKGEDARLLGRRPRTQVLQLVPMEGLASQAKPAHIRASIKPPTYAQCHAFQAHSLQITLLGSFAYEPNVIHGSLQIVSLQKLLPNII